VRVVIADDSVLVRAGLVALLAEAGIDCVGEAGDPTELLRLVEAERPDAAVVDIRMPPTQSDEGLAAAREINARFPSVAVLVLSQYVETSYAVRLLEDSASARGYLLKDRITDVTSLADALRRLVAGDCVIDPEIVARLLGRARRQSPIDDLSARERDVLALMAEGCSNRAICDRLFVSPKTLEKHVGSIFAKLRIEEGADTHRRVLAVLTYLREGG